MSDKEPIVVCCPKCLQNYGVTEESIKRILQNVKCSHCGYTWKHDFSPYLTVEKTSPDKPQKKSRGFAWILLLLAFVAASGVAIVHNRDMFRSILSHTNFDFSSYFSNNLRSTSPTLVVEDVKITRQKKTPQDRIETLLVTGKLLNLSDQNVSAPAIKISAFASCDDLPTKTLVANFFKPYSRNAGQCLHHRWAQPIKKEKILPFEKVTFAFTIPDNSWPEAQLVVHP